MIIRTFIDIFLEFQRMDALQERAWFQFVYIQVIFCFLTLVQSVFEYFFIPDMDAIRDGTNKRAIVLQYIIIFIGIMCFFYNYIYLDPPVPSTTTLPPPPETLEIKNENLYFYIEYMMYLSLFGCFIVVRLF